MCEAVPELHPLGESVWGTERAEGWRQELGHWDPSCSAVGSPSDRAGGDKWKGRHTRGQWSEGGGREGGTAPAEAHCWSRGQPVAEVGQAAREWAEWSME